MEESFLSKQNEGILLFNRGEYQSSLVIFNQLLNDYPSYHESHYNVAIALEKLDQPEEARDELLTAIELDDSIADYYYHLSVNLYKLHSCQEAERYIRKAIQLDQGNPEYHYLLAQYEGSKNQLELAIREFRTAIELDPLMVDAYIEILKNLKVMERWDDLKTEAFTFVKLFPDHPGIHSFLAEYYLHVKKWKEAQEEAQISLHHESWNPGFLLLQADSYFGMLNIDKAMQIANDILQRYPDYSPSYELLGRCYAVHTDYNNATRYYWFALQKDESNIKALIGLRTIYERLKDDDNLKKVNDAIHALFSKESTLS